MEKGRRSEVSGRMSLRCPACGLRGPFMVCAEILVEVKDGDKRREDYNPATRIQCLGCRNTGELKGFQDERDR